MFESLFCLLLAFRSGWALHQLAAPRDYGSIAYEYEKNAYPLAIADVWADNNQRSQALAFLQQRDPQAEQTLGVDLYSSFVLQGQIRKYFLLREALDPAYRDRMARAMDRLTRRDPLTQTADPPRKFWSESTDDCTTLVDCRNTDNLRAMRETAVYLMAEESGNEATRQRYKARLQRYVSTLQDIGMGEWDSPVYHGHTTAAYLNLYDFAQDPEVKQLAEDALNWLFRSAALKYWRGQWTGPAKRVHGNQAARFFWLYFGQAPPPTEITHNWIYALTSNYRPPPAVLQLAYRQMPRPVEIRRTHPHYKNWKPGRYGPAFYETLYLAHSYQLGSLARGTAGDWRGLSLHVVQGQGTDQLTVMGGGQHAIAQHRNLLLWQGESRPELRLPAGDRTTVGGITFVQAERTWLALRPVANGFALEVGEAQTHGSFQQFQTAVLNRSELQITADRVRYQGAQGAAIALQFQGDELPRVWRNGARHDWGQHTDTAALPPLP